MVPVFVYGTLRPGCGNDSLWVRRAACRYDGDCFVAGFRLVTNGAFPYALPAEDEVSVGALVYPHPAAEAEVMARLDALEGVPHHYERLSVDVATPDGVVAAWMYVPRRLDAYEGLEAVPGNDWIQYNWTRRRVR